MFKNNVYTFDYNDWQRGMNKSPYAGVSEMQNLDPFSKTGALLCGKKPTAVTDPVLSSFARHAVFDEENNITYYGLDGGRLLSQSSVGSFTSLSIAADECHGINLWKGYVIYAGENNLEAYDIDGTFFYNNWQTFEEGQRDVFDLPHQILVGRDDVVYITDGKYIASLQQQVGQVFDASDAATYTWNPTALDLPDGYVASSLSEYGTFLIIGTYYSATLNRGNRADIFPWDRNSQSFENPIRSKGNGVWQSIEHNGRLFALYDTKTQKIVQTNLSVYQVVEEIEKVTNARMHPDAIEVIDDEILFGIGSNSGIGINCAVYGTKLQGDSYVTHTKNTLSVGTTGVEIGSIVDRGEGEYIVTWEYNNTYGVDVFDSNVTDDYSSFIVDQYQIVAKQGSPKQFKTLELKLGKKLAAGQGVRVSYRANLDDDYTVLKTMDFDTYGAVSSVSTDIQMSPLTGMEIKIEMKGSGTTTPEFVSLMIL